MSKYRHTKQGIKKLHLWLFTSKSVLSFGCCLFSWQHIIVLPHTPFIRLDYCWFTYIGRKTRQKFPLLVLPPCWGTHFSMFPTWDSPNAFFLEFSGALALIRRDQGFWTSGSSTFVSCKRQPGQLFWGQGQHPTPVSQTCSFSENARTQHLYWMPGRYTHTPDWTLLL